MKNMKLGLQLGYWGAGPPANAGTQVADAERLGYDSIWTAEAYGSDALTPSAGGGHRQRGSGSEPPSANYRPGPPQPWPWRPSPSTTCRAADSSSVSACPVLRSSRVGTGSHLKSPGPDH